MVKIHINDDSDFIRTIGKHLVNSLLHTQRNDCNPLALDPNMPSLENVIDLVCFALLGMAKDASAFLHRSRRL